MNQAKKLVKNISLEQLRNIVAALNGEHARITGEDHKALVRYVEAWNKAKRNPWKIQPLLSREDAQRFSRQNLDRVWEHRLELIGRTPQTEKMVHQLERAGKRVSDDPPGGAYWHRSPTGKNFRDTAAMYISMLLTNPLRGDLSDGPCQRTLCGKWFIKRQRKQKNCSRRCTGIIQNAVRRAAQRATEHQHRLRLAEKAILDLKPSEIGGDWKKIVWRKTMINRSSLTRWINTGDLKPPKPQHAAPVLSAPARH
jgi:hypothetical protein